MTLPSLIPPPSPIRPQAEYWRKRVRKLSSRALSAIERAGPKAKALLETVKPTADERQKALELMAGASELRAYRLEPKEWTYMDVAGERKSGTAEEFQGALTDPLGEEFRIRTWFPSSSNEGQLLSYRYFSLFGRTGVVEACKSPRVLRTM